MPPLQSAFVTFVERICEKLWRENDLKTLEFRKKILFLHKEVYASVLHVITLPLEERREMVGDLELEMPNTKISFITEESTYGERRSCKLYVTIESLVQRKSKNWGPPEDDFLEVIEKREKRIRGSKEFSRNVRDRVYTIFDVCGKIDMNLTSRIQVLSKLDDVIELFKAQEACGLQDVEESAELQAPNCTQEGCCSQDVEESAELQAAVEACPHDGEESADLQAAEEACSPQDVEESAELQAAVEACPHDGEESADLQAAEEACSLQDVEESAELQAPNCTLLVNNGGSSGLDGNAGSRNKEQVPPNNCAVRSDDTISFCPIVTRQHNKRKAALRCSSDINTSLMEMKTVQVKTRAQAKRLKQIITK